MNFKRWKGNFITQVDGIPKCAQPTRLACTNPQTNRELYSKLQQQNHLPNSNPFPLRVLLKCGAWSNLRHCVLKPGSRHVSSHSLKLGALSTPWTMGPTNHEWNGLKWHCMALRYSLWAQKQTAPTTIPKIQEQESYNTKKMLISTGPWADQPLKL